MPEKRSLRVAGLFAGIGGFELGLKRAGHESKILCEIDELARLVLEKKFPDAELIEDVKDIDELRDIDLVTAGFPCQDLSQVGRTTGINGQKSGIVAKLFGILEKSDVPWLLIENVPFMLYLHRGAAIRYLTEELERLGYRWAYRVIDTRAFGLPQRRKRVFLLASKIADPAPIIFGTDATPIIDPRPRDIDLDGNLVGFYWTEGNRGGGWAENAIPALKPGSGKGIPSPPAILFPSGLVGIPDIEDAERLQGLPRKWTEAASNGSNDRYRWRLVGNAVSVPIAQWLGTRLVIQEKPRRIDGSRFEIETTWPKAAFGGPSSNPRMTVISTFPARRKLTALSDILTDDPLPLSSGATSGFASRLERSNLQPPKGFLEALWNHARSGHRWKG